MANKEMKTLTFGDVTYEVVDEKARNDIGKTLGFVANGTSTILNGKDVNEVISTEEGYNVVSGLENTLGINGYKMLSIVHANDIVDDTGAVTGSTSIDIELDDAKFEEANRAINNYAIKDVVVIQGSKFNVEDYAISALTVNNAGNTVVTVACWSVIDQDFTNKAVVSGIGLDGSDPVVEDWFWVRGKSYGEPVGRTQGAFLAGMENTSIGRYTFGGGRQNQLNGDGATAFGRQNTVGYLAFAMGRGNIALGGCVFGSNNISESNSSPFIIGTNNKTYSSIINSTLIFGHANTVYGGQSPILLGEANISYDEGNKYSAIVGYQNYIHDGKFSLGIGYRNHLYGESNLSIGHNNEIRGQQNFISGQYNNIADTAVNSGFIGKWLTGTGTEQFVVGIANENDTDAAFIVGNGANSKSRGNAFVVKKDGSAHIKKQSTDDDAIVRYDTLQKFITDLKSYIDTQITDIKTTQ